jgi:hypothetical protein
VCLFAGAGGGHLAWLINRHFKPLRQNDFWAAFVLILILVLVCTLVVLSCVA